MLVTILTKSGGLLGPIASILGLIMNGIYEFFHLFGIQNIALSIILFTFITRALMLPLTIKQQKFQKLSSVMNPELQKIQAKYKGKKDEVSLRKQQEETQAIYQKYGASPTAGCLPILITLPIMFALYSVINNIPAYVELVRNIYEPIANLIFENYGEYAETFTTIAEKIARNTNLEISSINQVIDVLAKFGTVEWNELSTGIPALRETIVASYPQIQQVNNFLGLNIANSPGWGFPGVLVPILAMGLQFIQGKQLQVKSQSKQDNPGAAAMNSMNVVMPIMSGFFCVTLPTGVGIYWIASSVFAIVQQFFVNKYMDRVDVDELIAKNVAKASKKVSRASSLGGTTASTSLRDLATKQTKSIESTATEKVKSTDTHEEQMETTSATEISQEGNPKSISEIANLLRNRNEKGDK